MYRICMISDFFYPNSGGVESHIFELSQCLLERGHKVIVVTRVYEDRVGIRYMTNGLKIYYCPMRAFYRGNVLPSIFASLPLLRHIWLRERIDIVHAHSAFSTIAHEGLLHAKSMGIHTVFTDHSLFGFADASAILTNSVLRLALSDCDHCVCVSFTAKENTVLRAGVSSRRVSVIPNAVDATVFNPAAAFAGSARPAITIVMVSRLVYRKGADLLAALLPLACRRHANIRFVIGGDGDRRQQIEQTVDQYHLEARVQLLGELKHDQVAAVMAAADIYINCSLTEAFCISLLEAAFCGLLVVSTNVGGVSEVLPADMLVLTQPSAAAMCAGLDTAIAHILNKDSARLRWRHHRQLAAHYNWRDIAARTEQVYTAVSSSAVLTFGERVRRVLARPCVFGVLLLVVMQLCRLLLLLLDWLQHASTIDIAVDWPSSCRRCRPQHSTNKKRPAISPP